MSEPTHFDAMVVGAGMAGLYMTHRLADNGYSIIGIDTADDVGGTWYWNRYPGARCDVPTTDYTLSFDPELESAWTWSEKYATQPEILRYLEFVADRYDLKRHYRFGTRLDRAIWDDAAAVWVLTVSGQSGAETVRARHLIMATGCLSVPKEPELDHADAFTGPVYVTGRWPHDPVDFSGQRVAVIGTGSSAIQSIPLIAAQADAVTVFQRTANFSMPARNGPTWEPGATGLATDRDGYRQAARWSTAGMPVPVPTERALELDAAERERRYEEAWSLGHLLAPGMFVSDLLTNTEANDTFAEFVRNKIRSIVDDPDTAEILCPTGYPYGTKRPCLDTDYYETFNLDHVALVDLTSEPITTVTDHGITTTAHDYTFDAIVYATGFDAMTGAIVAVDIMGRDGIDLKRKWADGAETYLGLMSAGFPNLFMITGPGSPSVLSNMAVSIEQHVDWITDALEDLRRDGYDTIEPTLTAEAIWGDHLDEAAAMTLFPQAKSWYMGANVPGKAQRLLPYPAGVNTYRSYCDSAVERDYLGFRRAGANGEHTVDGNIAPLEPDVQIMLNTLAQLGIPPLETMPVEGVREFSRLSAVGRPTGPDVGSVVDSMLAVEGGEIPLRTYHPPEEGTFPVIVYFHGGGWVIGDYASDDPLCRDLCARSNAIVVSVGYRKGPEHRFPTAVEDAWEATKWIADNAESFGGVGSRLAIAGWSAGANLATVIAQRARDEGAPALLAQVLITPVTDADLDRPSYVDNADGYVLTRGLMEWFFDHYVDPAERQDPRVVPLHGNLTDLPPTLIVTCEFDPLRDEGDAYATALASSGVDVDHVRAHGQIHTSIPAVDLLPTTAQYRERIGTFLVNQLWAQR